MLGLKLPHTVRVEKVVERDPKKLLTFVTQVPLTAARKQAITLKQFLKSKTDTYLSSSSRVFMSS